jgi:integrase
VEATDSQAGPEQREYTLGEWLEEWLRLCVLRGLRATSIETYRVAIGLYVSRELSSAELHSIRPQHLNTHYERMLLDGRRDGRGGLSPQTVRLIHAIIRRALADAIRLGLLDANPADAAHAPSGRSSQRPVLRTWTPSELRSFLESASEDELYPAFYLAATTGLRRSEILGLRWCDLDLEREQLQVVQTLVLVGRDVRTGSPKTDRSRRVVALDRQTVEVLRRHRRAMEARFVGRGRPGSDDLVFTAPDGEPIHPVLFTYYFRRRMFASGMRPIRLHDLRHTHATLALQAGVHPKVVSERLGHSTIAITLDTYSHVLPSMQREAAEAVAALVAAG